MILTINGKMTKYKFTSHHFSRRWKTQENCSKLYNNEKVKCWKQENC